MGGTPYNVSIQGKHDGVIMFPFKVNDDVIRHVNSLWYKYSTPVDRIHQFFQSWINNKISQIDTYYRR